VRQALTGSFEDPVVEKPNILRSLAGPAIELLEEGWDLVAEAECDVFYQGSVTPQK
jgi:AsmA protein